MSLTLAETGLRFYPLRIADIRRETADSVSLAFDVPAEWRDAFAFSPGQYLTLRTTLDGAEIRRSYSICSGADDGELRVAIKHVPDGVFSAHANTRLAPGDRIEVMPPAGRFGVAIEPSAAGVHVGIAAGSGITPILSILKTVLAREPRSRFLLFYGSRTSRDIMFREALDDLKDRFLDRLAIVHVLSREEQDVPVLNGRLDGEKIRLLLPAAVDPHRIDHVFLCGPSTMIDELTPTIAALGVPRDRIHSERFTPAGGLVRATQPRPLATSEVAVATATIIHDGKTSTVPVAAGEAILDAALRAGLDLPWSCHGGMCSTCRARIVAGDVAMAENYSLEPWELDLGYALTCQARPVTNTVIADYDQV